MPRSRRENSLRRRTGRLEQRERFLIYVEGEVSEPLYLNGVRAELGRSGPNVVIGRTHGEPLGLVEAAIGHRERDRRDGNPFTQVWCVFDVESPTPHGALDRAVALADRNNITCGITNPCFELWLILHFQEQRGWLTSDEACDRLMALECGYDKHGKAFNYELCKNSRETAAARADALGTGYEDAASLRDWNPWTSVQELFRSLDNACASI